MAWSDHLIKASNLERYEIIGGFLAFDCEKTYDMVNLWFYMEDYWFQMHYLDYVFDASPNGDQSVCALAVVSNRE